MDDARRSGRRVRGLHRVVLAVAVAVPLACAACSGSAKAAPSATPTHLTVSQVLPALLQCFVDHKLIPAAALQDSSGWIINGKVTDNLKLGDWFSENSDIVVRGKALADWLAAIEANSKAWPASICGAAPGFG